MSEIKSVKDLLKKAEELVNHVFHLKQAYNGANIAHAKEEEGKVAGTFTGRRSFAQTIDPLFREIENEAAKLLQLVNKLHEKNPNTAIEIPVDETKLAYDLPTTEPTETEQKSDIEF